MRQEAEAGTKLSKLSPCGLQEGSFAWLEMRLRILQPAGESAALAAFGSGSKGTPDPTPEQMHMRFGGTVKAIPSYLNPAVRWDVCLSLYKVLRSAGQHILTRCLIHHTGAWELGMPWELFVSRCHL